jgi:hypothetical protein
MPSITFTPVTESPEAVEHAAMLNLLWQRAIVAAVTLSAATTAAAATVLPCPWVINDAWIRAFVAVFR